MCSIFLAPALKAALEAGSLIREMRGGRFGVERKAGDRDFVTEVDRQAQERILSVLQASFPEHEYVGEEDGTPDEVLYAGLSSAKEDRYAWIVDPLDGTSNFVMGLPLYAVSIALVRGWELQTGVIYVPEHEEMFYAEAGRGAWCNEKPLRVAAAPDVASAMIGTGVPAVGRDKRLGMTRILDGLAPDCFNVRMFGSAAFSLASVACGRLAAMFETGLHPWDIAAGALIVSEAGGRISDLSGAPWNLTQPEVVASNGRIHEELLGYFAKR